MIMFILGLMIGAFLGVVFMCLLVAGRDYDDYCETHPLTKWVSVKERLPKESGTYLIFTGTAMMTAYYFGNDRWWLDYYDRTQTVTSDYFTHWMPLPEEPKE